MAETNHWNACVESILGMLEDILVRHHKTGPIVSKQTSRKPSRCTLYSAPLWKRSITGNQPHKRKRQVGMDTRDRKILRTCSTGSSTMFRSTPRSFDTTYPSPVMTASPPLCNETELGSQQQHDTTKKQQSFFNLTNSTKARLDQWLLLQTQQTPVAAKRDPTVDTKQLALDIHHIAHRLRSTSNTESNLSQQHYMAILTSDLVLFSTLIRQWLGLDPTNRIQTLFLDWAVLENYVYEMMAYIKGHEIMYQLDSIPRTDDLLYDIHSIQSILDDGIELLGTELTSKSQSWHEMGWQVDQDLWNTTKQQLEHLCIGLQHELSEEITKVGFTEKMMECTVCGLELMVSATELAGRTSLDLEHMDYCKPLVILFAQWTCKEMQQLKGQQQHLSTSTSRRTDLRLLQLLNNMTRVLVAFQMLVSRHHRSIDALASLLVDITIHVVSIMDQQLSNQNQSYIQRSNIMRTTFLPILYLEQSLVAFAEAVVALSDQNMPAYTQRIKWMSSLFD